MKYKVIKFTFESMDFDPFKKRISELNTLKPNKGNILVAEPFMQDDYFKRSVVYICENNADGTVGFILNEQLDLKLSEVITEELSFDAQLYLGGPVEARSLFFIHRCPDLRDSIQITEGIYWSGDFEMLKELIILEKVSIDELRFFLGYSGWDEQQLKDELKKESWLIGKIMEKDLFNVNSSNDLWKTTLQQMGKEQALLSTFPDNPNLN
ncbi:MAG: YqgE/AlgH family protein [Flavobacteriales bacterium]|nr:YqgE/AlgH family protein [Flavobacteriales bacterium]